EILAYLVILPTAVFSAISIIYARYKLERPVIELIKDNLQSDKKKRKTIFAKSGDENIAKGARKSNDRPFLLELSLSVLSSQKTLVFFIWFASFCFSAMTQMSISMKDLSSAMMGAMMMVIGLALAFTTLILAITTVINGNSKTIATMRAMGYSQSECVNAIFGGYRPFAYVGFAIGTAYQYGLLKIMVSFVFKDFADMPSYSFDWKVMLISLAVFAVVYEGIMLCCALRIRKIPIKQIMIE
ncbi:MAG: ABC transporter permease, partial [Clostridia bacterium]|nr:ABC transporter permease [Clostridia bacterium]